MCMYAPAPSLFTILLAQIFQCLVLFIDRRCIDVIFTFPKGVRQTFILALIQGACWL